MHRIDGANHAANLFTEGPPGTQVTDDWLNDVQENLVDTITSAPASIALVKGTYTQLASAIAARIADALASWLGVAHTWTAAQTSSINNAAAVALDAANAAGIALRGISGGAAYAGVYAKNTAGGPAVEVHDGDVKFNAVVSPAKNDSVVNKATAANLVKAWGRVTTDGIGGAVLDDGFNITSVACNSGVVDVTIAQDFSSANYCVTVTGLGAIAASACIGNVFSQAAGTLSLGLVDAAGALVDLNSVAKTFYFQCIGRQTG